MNEKKHEPGSIRRILVALDNSRHSLAALEAAAELAARLNAELSGLFVEDINLIRLAGLPFAQEIHYPSAKPQPLDRQRLEQELKVRAARARRAIAAAAERADVTWSFRVVRGIVTSEVLAAASEVDLLSLGVAGQPPAWRRIRLGSTARMIASAQAPHAVLLLQSGGKIKPPFMVTYDGTTIAKRALAIAVHLAQTVTPTSIPAIIVLTFETGAAEVVPHLEHEAAVWLQDHQIRANFRRLAKADVDSLVQAVHAGQGGFLILSSESLFSQPELIQVLVDKIDCPILLVK